MMRNLIIILSIGMLLFACKKETTVVDPRISDFSVTDVNRESFILDMVFIDESNLMISFLFANAIPQDSLPLTFIASFSLSAGATSVPASGEMITVNSLDETKTVTITGEDGHQIEYLLMVRDNQLPNNDFEDWYSVIGMDGIPYLDPGKKAESTLWATANHGTSMYGVYGTQPVTEGDNTVVQITTGETSMVPITAGTLFTGKFDINGAIQHPTDPRQATIFGIPFSLRPSAIKFKYSYEPGSEYIQATLNNPNNIFGGFTVTPKSGEDKFSAFAILEVRNSSGITEIGRAEIYSGDVQADLTELTLPFSYTSNQKPTHISVVFASSKEGEFFTGAVGSTLIIDDVELIYD